MINLNYTYKLCIVSRSLNRDNFCERVYGDEKCDKLVGNSKFKSIPPFAAILRYDNIDGTAIPTANLKQY